MGEDYVFKKTNQRATNKVKGTKELLCIKIIYLI